MVLVMSDNCALVCLILADFEIQLCNYFRLFSLKTLNTFLGISSISFMLETRKQKLKKRNDFKRILLEFYASGGSSFNLYKHST